MVIEIESCSFALQSSTWSFVVNHNGVQRSEVRKNESEVDQCHKPI